MSQRMALVRLVPFEEMQVTIEAKPIPATGEELLGKTFRGVGTRLSRAQMGVSILQSRG